MDGYQYAEVLGARNKGKEMIMKLSPQTWIILALLVIIALLLIFQRPKPTNEAILQARDSIKQITALNTVLSRRAESIAKELTLEKEKAKVYEKRFNEEIQKLTTRTTRLRHVAQPIYDSIPVLKQFVAVLDSTIQIQAARIDTLTSEKAFQAKLYEDLINLKDSLLDGKSKIIEQQTVIIVTQEKELRKAKRGNKALKVLAVGGSVIGLLLGSQL